ncbi:hypothetical protein NDU88_010851 [Pleurodeles waltl]|uniref:Uncharacterized protein n=1 Tax=Pleurodeles waltl TaxID=8319 RepID=A0AAV7S0H5_PLEWA|nr:hypothetical protein NDU88_010851 [Pleurodeles waltl]
MVSLPEPSQAAEPLDLTGPATASLFDHTRQGAQANSSSPPRQLLESTWSGCWRPAPSGLGNGSTASGQPQPAGHFQARLCQAPTTQHLAQQLLGAVPFRVQQQE